MKDKIQDELQKIEIPKTLHERSVRGVEAAKAEQEKSEKPVLHKRKRWISVVCALGILFSIILGTSYVTNNGELQTANFAITAYAMGDEGQEIHTDVTTERTIVEIGTDFREGLVAISGDGPNYIFTDVRLGVTGEQIESITYKLNEGMFIEDVTFSYEQFIDKEWLLAEKINFIGREPDSDVYEGIKDVGSSYQVRYEDQGQHNYTLALPHDGNEVVSEGIIITVQVEYKDGNTEQREIMVTQESNEIVLKLM